MTIEQLYIYIRFLALHDAWRGDVGVRRAQLVLWAWFYGLSAWLERNAGATMSVFVKNATFGGMVRAEVHYLHYLIEGK